MLTVMRAALLTGHGGPDRIDVRHDVPVPSPTAGEVVVRVTASSVNNTDIWSREGAYGTADDPTAIAGWRGVPLSFPRIQGGDVAGVVVSEGDGVTGLAGKRVVVDCALYDANGSDATPIALLGSERDGGFAEYVAVDAARVHDMTTSPLTDEELACLPIAFGTAIGMIDRGGVTSGDRVVVTGASGGVGAAAVQLLAAIGAHVVAVTSSDKADQVRSLGAEQIVERGDDVPARIMAEAGGPADAILDVVGGPDFGGLTGVLRSGGTLVVAGAIAGAVVTVDLRQVYLDQRRIVGSTMHTPASFARLVELARDGSIRPRIADTYPLDDLHLAQQTFSAKKFVGKLVIVPTT